MWTNILNVSTGWLPFPREARCCQYRRGDFSLHPNYDAQMIREANVLRHRGLAEFELCGRRNKLVKELLCAEPSEGAAWPRPAVAWQAQRAEPSEGAAARVPAARAHVVMNIFFQEKQVISWSYAR